MKLRCGLGSTVPEIVAKRARMCLKLFTGQVLGHEVSGVGRTLDLDKSDSLAQLLLLLPKSPDILASDPANSSPLEDAQGRGGIDMKSGVHQNAKVCHQRHSSQGFCRGPHDG